MSNITQTHTLRRCFPIKPKCGKTPWPDSDNDLDLAHMDRYSMRMFTDLPDLLGGANALQYEVVPQINAKRNSAVLGIKKISLGNEMRKMRASDASKQM